MIVIMNPDHDIIPAMTADIVCAISASKDVNEKLHQARITLILSEVEG